MKLTTRSLNGVEGTLGGSPRCISVRIYTAMRPRRPEHLKRSRSSATGRGGPPFSKGATDIHARREKWENGTRATGCRRPDKAHFQTPFHTVLERFRSARRLLCILVV